MNPDKEALYCYVIFYNPKDFPGKYVVRKFLYALPTIFHSVFDTLEQARAWVPRGLYRIVRDPRDEFHIIETWL